MKVFSGVLFLCSIVLIGPLGAQSFRYGNNPVPEAISQTTPHARVTPLYGSNTARAVDLSRFFPRPGNQGQQNSCVAWATAYAVKSYQEHIEKKQDGFASDSLIFSPSFVYNQINDGVDEGSSLYDAGNLLKSTGAIPITVMPYSTDYRRLPTAEQLRNAAPYRISGFERIRPDAVDAIKEFLRNGKPVVIGMQLYQNFDNYRGGVYSATSGPISGGHAMVVLGFDDDKGAFKIINSWGTQWGEGGYVWISYEVFARTNREAMVMHDIQVASPQVIDVPQNVSASQGTNPDYVEVLWGQVTGAESYEVYRSVKPSESFIRVAEVQGTVYMDRTVTEGAFFYYSIRAKKGTLVSSYTPSVQGFLQTQPGIGIVQDLQTKIENKQIQLWWKPVEGAQGYNIYKYIEANDQFGKVGTSQTPGWADIDGGKTPGTYYYLVTAFAGQKEGPNSNSVSVVVTEEPVVSLVSPRGIVATQGRFADRVDLSWEAVPGAQQYVILRYNEQTGAWSILDGTRTLTWSDRRPLTRLAYYTVVSRIGDTLSTIDGYVTGHTSRVRTSQTQKTYDDKDYFGSGNVGRITTPQASLFSDDTSIKDPTTFITSFVPQDFFYIDTEKFFMVNPDFFKVGDQFFTINEGFFKTP